MPGVKLDYLLHARSYKSLQFLTQKLNALMFYHKVLEIAPSICIYFFIFQLNKLMNALIVRRYN